MAHDVQTVRATLERTRGRLLAQTHVLATGVGYKTTQGVKTDALAIVCSVTEKVPLNRLRPPDRVPTAIGGIPTDVVATGVIRALQSRTARHRPAPAGVSIGHRSVTAGTLGCLVRRAGQVFSCGSSGIPRNLLVVVYTYREPDVIRVISAWKANKHQRRLYEGLYRLSCG